MNSPSFLQRAAFLCLLGLAFVMPLVPVAREAPMDKHLIFAAFAGAGGLLLWLDALRGRLAPTLGTPTDVAFFGFLACVLPSALAASNPGMARIELGNVACFGLTFVLAVKTLRTPRAVHLLYAVVLLGGVVISALGLEAYSRFLVDPVPEVARSGYLSTALFPHSYLAAQYVVLVFVGSLVMLLEAGSRGLPLLARVLTALALLPQAAYLLAIGSRGAYLAVLVALLVSAVMRVRSAGSRGRMARVLRLLARGIGGMVLAGVLYGLATFAGLLDSDALQNALERVLYFFDPKHSENNFERLEIWRSTLAMVADNLVTGVGLGCYASGILIYQTAARVVPHAHNQFLQVAAQSGLVGLVGLLFLLRTGLHAARKGAAYLIEDDERRPAFHAALAALAAALVYFLLETPLHWIEAGSLIVILLAILTRAGCMSRDAVSAPWAAHGALAIAALALAVAVPGWRAFHEFSLARSRAARVAQSAWAAEAAGDQARADELWERTEELLASADAIFPHTLEVTTQATQQAWARGDLERALAWQTLGDERFPGAPFQRSNLGNLYAQLQRQEHALPLLREVAQRTRGPEAASRRAALARVYQRSGRYEEAWFLQRELVEDPQLLLDEASVLLDAAGTLLMLHRELPRAQELLDRFAAEHPEEQETARYQSLRRRLEQQLGRPPRNLQRGAAWSAWSRR